MKLNRRQLVSAAAGSTLAARAMAQQTPVSGTPAAVQTDFMKAARDLNQRNAETLAKFDLPFFTEPAFQFRA
jgi:hypothetical protein